MRIVLQSSHKAICAVVLTLTGFTLVRGLSSKGLAQRPERPAKQVAVCGNPNVTCPTTHKFEPYELPFRVPKNAVISDSELFYAVILRSALSPTYKFNCDPISEPDRLAAQILFPNNKVFTSRCAEAELVAYSNNDSRAQFMAVYAGSTLAAANAMLAKVKATGKFPGANIRRMRGSLNGT